MRLKATRFFLVGMAVLFGTAIVDAQVTSERARTSSGREVVLRSDGTWTWAPVATPPAAPPVAAPPPPAPSAQPAAPQTQQQRPPLQPLFPNAAPPPPQARPPVAAPLPPAPAQPAAQPQAASPQRASNARPVQRPRDATSQHTSRRGNFRFWYNPAKWKPTPENPDGRVQFQLVGQEAFIVLIPEGTPLPIAQLKTVALENARQSGSDARIVAEETRSIQGRDVLQMQINVTIDGTPIAFIGRYFGDPRGSVQLVGFTAQSDLQRYRALILEGLDGLDLNR